MARSIGVPTIALPALLALPLFALVTMVQGHIVPSTKLLPVFIALALFCAIVVTITRYDPFLRTERRPALIFTLLAMFVLAATSVLYLIQLHESSPSSTGYVWDAEHIGELGKLSGEHRFWLDGHLDEWVYVLFKHGLFALQYGYIGVQERGLLFFYAALMRIAGDFNMYLPVVANCVALVLSSWLLLRIAAQFAPSSVAFGAAALLLVRPDALLWGAALHKDNFVVLLVLLCLWSALKAFAGQSRPWAYSGVFAASLIGLAFCRSGLVVPLLCASALAIVLARNSPLERLTRYAIAVGGGVALLAAILPSAAMNDLRMQVFDRLYYKLAEGSSYKVDVKNITFTTTPESSLVYKLGGGDLSLKKLHLVPVRVAMYFVAPFPPWPIRIRSDYFVLLGTWLLIPLWFFFLKGCWKGLRQGSAGARWALLFFVVIAVAVAFAGGFVYERYRVLFMPFYLCFAALGEYLSTPRQKLALIGAALCAFVALLAIYWTLKIG